MKIIQIQQVVESVLNQLDSQEVEESEYIT